MSRTQSNLLDVLWVAEAAHTPWSLVPPLNQKSLLVLFLEVEDQGAALVQGALLLPPSQKNILDVLSVGEAVYTFEY